MRIDPIPRPGGFYAVGLDIQWQSQPLGHGVNGATVETILRCCVERLLELNAKVACQENIAAIQSVQNAIQILDMRTRDRVSRGVDGSVTP